MPQLYEFYIRDAYHRAPVQSLVLAPCDEVALSRAKALAMAARQVSVEVRLNGTTVGIVSGAAQWAGRPDQPNNFEAQDARS